MSWANRRVQIREKKPLISLVDLPSKFIFSKNSNHVDAVICAIALNEERYIDEWIKYNILLGFTHIYIYDNSHNNILKKKESDKVTIIHFPGITKQLEAYDSFVGQYKNKHTWAAFIDCDEFIVLKKHDNILSFLNKYANCESIAINWLMFGTNNEKEYRDEPVSKRFRYCSNKIDIHIKSIVKLNHINKFTQPHSSELISGHNFDTNMNIVIGPFNYNGDDKIACIHHYYTKSEQEFREKIERGRADVIQKISIDSLNNIHSKNNDIYNSNAWDFYSKYL